MKASWPKSTAAGAAAFCFAAGLATTAPMTAQAQPFAPKYQQYDLKPHSVSYDVEITVPSLGSKSPALKGTTREIYSRYCGSWRSSVRSRFSGTVGPTRQNRDVVIKQIELAGGKQFSLRETGTENGRRISNLGVAEVTANGRGEVFAETKGQRVIVSLPAGTLFPMEHFRRVMIAVLTGKREYGAYVYGLLEAETVVWVRARIVPLKGKLPLKVVPSAEKSKDPKKAAAEKPAQAAGGTIPRSLGSNRLWQVDYAFFDEATGDRARIYRQRLIVNADGLVIRDVFTHGSIQFESRISKAAIVKERECVRTTSGEVVNAIKIETIN